VRRLPRRSRRRSRANSMRYHHVYILESVADPQCHYTGFTDLSVEERLAYHNAGQVPHTAKSRPWRIKTYVAFSDREKALAFERYLKSHSGRAFATKRL